MNHQITIREAVTPQEIAAFWSQLRAYYVRDIFPDPADGDRPYFLSDAYRENIQRLHDRPRDRVHYLFLCRDGQEIGIALAALFDTEDGKCFLLEFCVFPQARGAGTGSACGRAFLDWARACGAAYTELNCDDPRRRCFWSRLGFRPNGADEWGMPLMLRPPEVELPVTVERLDDPEDWQLMKLENGFRTAVGEQPLTEGEKQRLRAAVAREEFTFFLARRGTRAVGMCSVSPCFSTFACKNCGVFDDFYVEPVFRGQGIARLLVTAARSWCAGQGMASLMLGCSEGDAAMYRSLGFDVPLGRMLACALNAQD